MLKLVKIEDEIEILVKEETEDVMIEKVEEEETTEEVEETVLHLEVEVVLETEVVEEVMMIIHQGQDALHRQVEEARQNALRSGPVRREAALRRHAAGY